METAFVEVDDVVERRGGAIVEEGARAASARRIGPLNFPMSAHLPVIIARPGSVVWIVSPVEMRRSV